MNITVIVALVAAISAIVAPSVTEIIRSRNELRLKKLEMIYPAKQNAYQDFSTAFGRWSANKESYSLWLEAASATRNAAVLAEKNGRDMLQKLATCPMNERDAVFQHAISTLAQELSIIR